MGTLVRSVYFVKASSTVMVSGTRCTEPPLDSIIEKKVSEQLPATSSEKFNLFFDPC